MKAVLHKIAANAATDTVTADDRLESEYRNRCLRYVSLWFEALAEVVDTTSDAGVIGAEQFA